jgi:hypothetical protein
MKRLLFLLFLFLKTFCIAQNYQCLQGGVKHYFTNGSGYVRGIRIDSVRTSGSDIIYYPFHTPRGRYLSSMYTILDSNGGSWLGKKIIQQNDGTFLFDNIWHDTVVIKTQAHLGDSWVFYNDTTGRYYMGYIAVEDTMTVLGVLDSVKRIGLMTYNAGGYVASDSINNYEIVFSKNNGFVKTIDLYTFPYHPPDSAYTPGIDFYLDMQTNYGPYYPYSQMPSTVNTQFTLTQLINPSWIQLYDNDTGDQFEYRVYWNSDQFFPYEYYLDSIVNKTNMGDSVDYDYTGWRATENRPLWATNPSIGYPFSLYGNTHSQMFYNNLLIDTVHMPEEYKSGNMLYYYPEDNSYCMNSCKYRFSENAISNDIISDIYFEGRGFNWYYKIGLGLVESVNYDGGADVFNGTKLIYYVRSGVSCGTYVMPKISGIKELAYGSDIYTLYPNPAFGTLTVSGNDPITAVAITNLIGETVYTHQYNSKQVQIDIADLPKGMYLVRINCTEVRKFMKE